MSGRIHELDSLRGVACVIIVLLHALIIPDSAWWHSLLDMFFVLSSYLITTLILKYREERGFLKTFYQRRFLRILPPYYLALAAVLLLNPYMPWDDRTEAWLSYATFTQNLPHYLKLPLPDMSRTFLHAWTLAIEEQFYLIWPLLLLRARIWQLLLIAIFLILVAPVLRTMHYWPHLLFTRSDGLGLGAMLALLLYDGARVRRHAVALRWMFVALAAGAVLWVPARAGIVLDVPQPFFYTRASVVWTAVVGILVVSRGAKVLAIMRDPRLCYLGTISYALYLAHPIVIGASPLFYRPLVVRGLGFNVPWVEKVVLVLLSLGVAELSRRFLEAPLMARKDKMKYKARQAAVPSTEAGS